MTKPTKWHVRPAKTQISLGICPLWSVCCLPTERTGKTDQTGRMPRWIWVFAGHTVILLVCSYLVYRFFRTCKPIVKDCLWPWHRPLQSYYFCETVQNWKKNLVNIEKMIDSEYLCLPPVGLGDILFFPWSSVHPSIRLSVTKSCLLCNSKTVRDIFMKLYTNVKQQETTCRAQEP